MNWKKKKRHLAAGEEKLLAAVVPPGEDLPAVQAHLQNTHHDEENKAIRIAPNQTKGLNAKPIKIHSQKPAHPRVGAPRRAEHDLVDAVPVPDHLQLRDFMATRGKQWAASPLGRLGLPRRFTLRVCAFLVSAKKKKKHRASARAAWNPRATGHTSAASAEAKASATNQSSGSLSLAAANSQGTPRQQQQTDRMQREMEMHVVVRSAAQGNHLVTSPLEDRDEGGEARREARVGEALASLVREEDERIRG